MFIDQMRGQQSKESFVMKNMLKAIGRNFAQACECDYTFVA